MLSALKEKRMRQNWPAKLWLVRHGQSQGNVARDAADEAGLHEIAIDVRDVDVPLSELGHDRPRRRAAGSPLFRPRPARGDPVVALRPRAPDGGGDPQGRGPRGP